MALIKCGKCGVKYNEKAEVCPCCGAENRHRTKQKDGTGAGGRKERTGGRKEMSTLAFILFLAVLCVAVFFAVRFLMQGNSPGKETGKTEAGNSGSDETVQIMEKYLDEEKYDELYEYYQGLGSYDPVYEKYWEVASTWNWMKFMRETKEALATNGESPVFYGISYALSGSSKALMIIDGAVNDEADHGNEEILKGFQEEIMSFLKEDLQLSAEETEMVIGAAKGKSSEWDAMESYVLDRLNLSEN